MVILFRTHVTLSRITGLAGKDYSLQNKSLFFTGYEHKANGTVYKKKLKFDIKKEKEGRIINNSLYCFGKYCLEGKFAL